MMGCHHEMAEKAAARTLLLVSCLLSLACCLPAHIAHQAVDPPLTRADMPIVVARFMFCSCCLCPFAASSRVSCLLHSKNALQLAQHSTFQNRARARLSVHIHPTDRARAPVGPKPSSNGPGTRALSVQIHPTALSKTIIHNGRGDRFEHSFHCHHGLESPKYGASATEVLYFDHFWLIMFTF